MTKTNEQAFPLADIGLHGGFGLTKREYFAAAALPGVLAICIHDTITPGQYPQHCAKNAVEMADALIAELNKEQPK